MDMIPFLRFTVHDQDNVQPMGMVTELLLLLHCLSCVLQVEHANLLSVMVMITAEAVANTQAEIGLTPLFTVSHICGTAIGRVV